ncbi:hypothetical protein VHA01S_046_00360 [Vibrio halioticoli NBRC 102217]|uniref:Uncharacterized protein n=1 Tax=Vibrio halioticoli NBRC 102217 TaxID=1219072 RepID=V5FP21_9VIBR|nr:hypothetical protein VHA01S_046_00360 [Vibrio halioticoli NBRC 102217]
MANKRMGVLVNDYIVNDSIILNNVSVVSFLRISNINTVSSWLHKLGLLMKLIYIISIDNNLLIIICI